jgi:prefoldin subunit 5
MPECHIAKMIWRASQSSFANVRRVIMNLQTHINDCAECKKIINDIKAEGIKL